MNQTPLTENHPEIRYDESNPILSLIYCSIIKADDSFDLKLTALIQQHPDAYQKIDMPTLIIMLAEAYSNLNFFIFFCILKHFKQVELKKTAIELMISPCKNIQYQDSLNIFYLLARTNATQFFNNTVTLLGIDASKNCIRQPIDMFCNAFHAFWVKKHYGICKNILNLFPLEARFEILLEIIREELDVYFSLYLELRFPRNLDYLLIPHIVNLNVEHEVDIPEITRTFPLEKFLCLRCPELVSSETKSLLQYIWQNPVNIADTQHFTLATLMNEQIQNHFLIFIRDENNTEINCFIKVVQYFDGTVQYIEFIKKISSLLRNKLQESIKEHRENYNVLFDLLLKHKSAELTTLLLKLINSEYTIIGMYQKLIMQHQNIDEIKIHFFVLILQYMVNHSDEQQEDHTFRISNSPEYQQIFNHLIGSQQDATSFETSQIHVDLLIAHISLTNNFILARKLLALLSIEEQQLVFVRKQMSAQEYPGLLPCVMNQFPEDPLNPFLSLPDSTAMINALLSRATEQEIRFTELVWITSTVNNVIDTAIFLSTRLPLDEYLALFLDKFKYQTKEYTNIINYLIDHNLDKNAVALLSGLKDQAHKVFLAPWIEYKENNDTQPNIYPNALCYFLRVRKTNLLPRILELKMLKEDHLKAAFLQINQTNGIYYYLLYAINRGFIPLLTIGLSVLDNANANQTLRQITNKKMNGNDLSHNLITYAFLEFNNLTPVQIIDIIKIAIKYVGKDITTLISLPFNNTESFLHKLMKINNKELSMFIIKLFQNPAELILYTTNFTDTTPDCPAKKEILDIIQPQINRLSPPSPVLSPIIAQPLKPNAAKGAATVYASLNQPKSSP